MTLVPLVQWQLSLLMLLLFCLPSDSVQRGRASHLRSLTKSQEKQNKARKSLTRKTVVFRRLWPLFSENKCLFRTRTFFFAETPGPFDFGKCLFRARTFFLRKRQGGGHNSNPAVTAVEVWARCVQCVARGEPFKLFGEPFFCVSWLVTIFIRQQLA